MGYSTRAILRQVPLMPSNDHSLVDRRQFVKTAAVGAAAALTAPAIVTASKSDSEIILGEGDHRYRVTHDWAKLPSEFEWQTTHNVTIDRDGYPVVSETPIEIEFLSSPAATAPRR